MIFWKKESRQSGLMTVVCAAVALMLASTAFGQYVVTSNLDSVPTVAGELRFAIGLAESDAGPSTISFALPPSSTITLSPVNGPLTLASEDQTWIQGPGASQLEINAASLPQAFIIQRSGCTISDLSIFNASSQNIAIDGIAGGGLSNWIYGCQIGLDLTGAALGSNETGVLITAGAAYNVIGTDGVPAGPAAGGTPGWNGEPGAVQNLATGAVTDALERNVISNNNTNNGGRPGGVVINSGSFANRVAGNFIGTDLLGTTSIPNTDGVVLDVADENIIGISGPVAPINLLGGGEADEWNLISGNDQDGVFLDASDLNWISGNLIGTDVTGTTTLLGTNPSNMWHGVQISIGSSDNIVGIVDDGSADTVLGAPMVGEGNLLSGNNANGLMMDSGATMNMAKGNFIGVDITGAAPLGNGTNGVELDTAPMNLIGTDADTLSDSLERNVISCNANRGIFIAADMNLVWGNIIGLDVNENGITPGNVQSGISLSGTTACGIGFDQLNLGSWLVPPVLPSNIQRNVISNNGLQGILLSGTTCAGNAIIGNWIGTDSSETANVPNVQSGIRLQNGANNNTIGWVSTMLSVPPNVITNNGADGITIDDSSTLGTVSNVISGNSITANTLLGIENVNNGNTEEPPPVITTIDYVLGTVSGTSAAEDSSVVEVFVDANDEGQIYVGNATVTSNAWSATSIVWPLAPPFNTTATVRDTTGNTSEFSTPQTVTRVGDWLLLDD